MDRTHAGPPAERVRTGTSTSAEFYHETAPRCLPISTRKQGVAGFFRRSRMRPAKRPVQLLAIACAGWFKDQPPVPSRAGGNDVIFGTPRAALVHDFPTSAFGNSESRMASSGPLPLPLPLILILAFDLWGPSVAAGPADKTRRAPRMDARRFPRGQDAPSENPAGSADPAHSAGREGGVCFFAPGFLAQAKKGGSRRHGAKALDPAVSIGPEEQEQHAFNPQAGEGGATND